MYTYCANNPVYYSDPTGHFMGEAIALATAQNVVKVAIGFIAVSCLASMLNQPQVQSGISDMANKAANAFEKAVSKTCSLTATIAGAVATSLAVTMTDITKPPRLSSPLAISSSGVMSSFSTTVDSDFNPYLAPWLYASMGSQTIAKDDADSVEKDITFPWPSVPKTYYHYTTEENAMAILKSGKILPDERGRVFLTPYLYSPDEVNNSKSSDYGEYRITVQLYASNDPCLSKLGATQWNEIIYYGTIRDGRNASLTVMKNE